MKKSFINSPVIYEIKAKTTTFSAPALSETWFNDDMVSFHSVPSYNAVHSCWKNKLSGGVSVFVDSDFQFIKKELSLFRWNWFTSLRSQVTLEKSCILSSFMMFHLLLRSWWVTRERRDFNIDLIKSESDLCILPLPSNLQSTTTLISIHLQL